MKHTTVPTAAHINARMTHEEAARLARQFRAQPYTSYYRSTSETTGKERVIYHTAKKAPPLH